MVEHFLWMAIGAAVAAVAFGSLGLFLLRRLDRPAMDERKQRD